MHTQREAGAMLCVGLCHRTVVDVHGKEWWCDGGSKSGSDMGFGVHYKIVCEAPEVPAATHVPTACGKGSGSPPTDRLRCACQSNASRAFSDRSLTERQEWAWDAYGADIDRRAKQQQVYENTKIGA